MPSAILVTTGFPPVNGGVQTMLYELCRNLRRLRISVVAPHSPGADAWDRAQPFPIIRTRSPLKNLLSHVPALTGATVALALRQRPDLVIAGHVDAAPAALAAQALLRVPWAVIGHGAEMAVGWSPKLAALALPRAGCLVCSSHATRERAMALGASAERCFTTSWGVSPEHLQPAAAALPEAWGLGRGPTLLTVARLDEWRKGHDAVIRALPDIAVRVPDVRYVIAGDGALRRPLEGLAEQTGVARRCVFTGAVPNATLMALYDRADVFVMPSREAPSGAFEGFGLVYLEANAHGLPVIAGRSGGSRDAVVDGVTGVLVDATSPPAIAEAAADLLAKPDLRRAMGQAGRDRVQRDLTWPAVAARIEDVLLHVAARGTWSG